MVPRDESLFRSALQACNRGGWGAVGWATGAEEPPSRPAVSTPVTRRRFHSPAAARPARCRMRAAAAPAIRAVHRSADPRHRAQSDGEAGAPLGRSARGAGQDGGPCGRRFLSRRRRGSDASACPRSDARECARDVPTELPALGRMGMQGVVGYLFSYFEPFHT